MQHLSSGLAAIRAWMVTHQISVLTQSCCEAAVRTVYHLIRTASRPRKRLTQPVNACRPTTELGRSHDNTPILKIGRGAIWGQTYKPK